jgi:hypothetical protein
LGTSVKKFLKVQSVEFSKLEEFSKEIVEIMLWNQFGFVLLLFEECVTVLDM